jgi:hypothetical protein
VLIDVVHILVQNYFTQRHASDGKRAQRSNHNSTLIDFRYDINRNARSHQIYYYTYVPVLEQIENKTIAKIASQVLRAQRGLRGKGGARKTSSLVAGLLLQTVLVGESSSPTSAGASARPGLNLITNLVQSLTVRV